jgi:hypothetical protein
LQTGRRVADSATSYDTGATARERHCNMSSIKLPETRVNRSRSSRSTKASGSTARSCDTAFAGSPRIRRNTASWGLDRLDMQTTYKRTPTNAPDEQHAAPSCQLGQRGFDHDPLRLTLDTTTRLNT